MSSRGMKRTWPLGPSSTTWSKWVSPWVERTSVRTIPSQASLSLPILAGSIGFVKLGQPQPDSYLSELVNKGSPDALSMYRPGRFGQQRAALPRHAVLLGVQRCHGFNGLWVLRHE